MQASDGNFYGTTESGSLSGEGVIFRMSPRGSVIVIHTFVPSGTEGQFPGEGWYRQPMATCMGPRKRAAVTATVRYTRSPPAEATPNCSASRRNIGQDPLGGLLQHTNGTLYGTASRGGANGFGAIYSLDMGLGPFITFVNSTGRHGSAAQILGQGLTGTTSVTFNGVPATSFKVLTDTYLTAVIPAGATTGPVVVTTSNSTFTSNKNFRVRP